MGKIYSFNEGNFDLWDQPTRDYITSLKDPAKWGGKPYSVCPSNYAAAALCPLDGPQQLLWYATCA